MLFAVASPLLVEDGVALPEKSLDVVALLEESLLPSDGAALEVEALPCAVLLAAGCAGCCCDASITEKGELEDALPLLAGVAGFAAAAFAAALEVATALVGIEAKKKIRIEPALP